MNMNSCLQKKKSLCINILSCVQLLTLWIIFSCCCFSHTYADAGYQITHDFDQYVTISKTGRPSSPIDAANRNARNEYSFAAIQPEIIASEKLWSLVPDYSFAKNLDDSIKYFLKRSLNVDVESLSCVDPALIPIAESVFIARNEQLVVKVFMHKERFLHKISREISGMEVMKSLKLKHGKLVDFLALGKCTIGESEYFLLAETLAPGSLVCKTIENIFNSENRESSIVCCKNALKLLGQALGEVHASKAIKVEATAEVLILTINSGKIKTRNSIEAFQQAGGQDCEQVKCFFDKILEEYDSSNVYYAVHHGDAHLGNFLYDEVSNSIYIIDTPRAHRTVDLNNKSISPDYVHDLAVVEEDIARWVLHHEQNEELIMDITKAFYEGYRLEAERLIIPSQIKLKLANDILRRWRLNLGWQTELDSTRRAQKQRLAERSRAYFITPQGKE